MSNCTALVHDSQWRQPVGGELLPRAAGLRMKGGQPHTEVIASQTSLLTEVGNPDSHGAIIIVKKGGSSDVI